MNDPQTLPMTKCRKTRRPAVDYSQPGMMVDAPKTKVHLAEWMALEMK